MALLSSWLKRQRLRKAAPYVTGSTLDFGCGDGALAEFVADYVGVDINTDNLAKAREAHHAEFLLPDELKEERRFSTVALIAVVEHLHDPVEHLEELCGRLRPGGRIVVTTPHPRWEWLHSVGSRVGLVARSAHHAHVSLLDREGLRQVAEDVGLDMVVYRRFLGGLNQLAVFQVRSQ